MELHSPQTGPAALAGSLDLSPLAAFSLSHDQYLGPWAIEETRGLGLLAHVQALDLNSHVRLHAEERFDQSQSRIVAVDPFAAGASQSGPAGAVGQVRIAIVSLEGPMLKRPSSLSPGASTIRARQALRAAAADPDVSAIVIRFDSPGGTVSGTHDLAADVRDARRRKPVVAFIEDLGASAAYLVASQADQVFANEPGALVGSIGVLWGLYDLSARAAMQGVRPVVISSGGLKGTGFEGTQITADQQAYLQELVNDANQAFVAAVATGRGKSVETVRTWNSGRVWPAAEAQKLGLIDGIQSLDATLHQLAVRAAQPRTANRKAETMSDAATTTAPATVSAPNAPPAASYQQIVAACAGLKPGEAEDAMFVTQQLEQGVTAQQATANWMQTLTVRVGAARQEQAQRPGTSAIGVEPLVSTAGSASVSAGNGGNDFWAAVAEKQNAGLTREQAISAAVREDPDRHAAMLSEYNATHARRK